MASPAAAKTKTCPRCFTRYDDDAAFCPRDGMQLSTDSVSPEDDDPYIGAELAGDIVIRNVAGAGAMGRVYRAHQVSIDRDVAVKILHRELSANPQLKARFHREAKIATKLQHPHVVEIYFTGQMPDGALYMVMEFLDGISLAGLIAAEGSLSVVRTLGIVLQVCDALGEGHARGIVHRDVKPENVMLVHRSDVAEWVKVLDFGIAKLNVGEQSMETQAGLIFGTARYISPEAAHGAVVGPPGDVYSLATMVYQMLCGKTPFDADQAVGILIKHIHEAPPPLRSHPSAKDVPAAIEKVIMDNLAKEPAERAPNARAFGAQLAAAARQSNVSISDVGVVARLSSVDVMRVNAGVAPTLDDASAVPAIPAEYKPAGTVPLAPIKKELSEPPPASKKKEEDAAPAPAPVPEKHKSRAPIGIVLAFLVGIGATFGALRFANRGNAEREAVRDRARAALADSHYVTPPGDNVRDITNEGLKRWPDDPELKHLRSQAEQGLITMAVAARTSRDIVGARDRAKEAWELAPTDNSARFLKAQCEDELTEVMREGYSGSPRLVFESPPIVKQGTRIEMKARIVPGNAKPDTIGQMAVSLLPNGKTSDGTPVTLNKKDSMNATAVLTAPTPGSYDVTFEAQVGGTVVRAMRDLDVTE